MDEHNRPGEPDSIERLLRLAGPRATAPDQVADRVRSVVHAHWRASLAPRRQWHRSFWIVGSLAAASLILLFLRGDESTRHGSRLDPGLAEQPKLATLLKSVGIVRTSDGHPLEVGAVVHAGTELESGPSVRAALLLAGGTSLRIDQGTRLTLLPDSVVVLTRGAVYADTGHDQDESARAPLEIRTRFGSVRDVGTRFQVRLDDVALSVDVREGIARFETGGTTREAIAGFQLSVEEGKEVTTREAAVSGPRWSWILQVSPPFELEGRSLGEFLDWVERETGWSARFADPSTTVHARSVVLHGTMGTLTPDEAPEAVLAACGLRSRLVGDTMLIEQPGKGARLR